MAWVEKNKRALGLYPSIHQIKGWNCKNLLPFLLLVKVSIHQSIKSRVETWAQCYGWIWGWRSLSINPSNQGLKLIDNEFYEKIPSVSIHQSIKSRVETHYWACLFLSMAGLYPSIHQIKGWNPFLPCPVCWTMQSLSINPSNQGLKLAVFWLPFYEILWVSIHQSIKSRVETEYAVMLYSNEWGLYPSIHQIKGWNC